MKSFIFAAGNGTRMNYPEKLFLKINGVPLIERLMNQIGGEIIVGVNSEIIAEKISKIRSVKFVYIDNPEDSMIMTLKAAESMLSGEEVFMNFCADEIYTDSVIEAAKTATGNKMVSTYLTDRHGTTGIVAFSGECFKYIKSWIRDRDQLILVMMADGIPIEIEKIDGGIININTWDSYRFAKRIHE